MTNPYYVRSFDVMPGNTVGSQRLEDEFALVAQGFDTLNTAVALLAGNTYPMSSVHNFTAATLRVANPVAANDAVNLATLNQVSMGTKFPVTLADAGKYAYSPDGINIVWAGFSIPANAALSGPVITGEKLVKVALGAGTAIDLSTGNYFTKTISGSTTLTLSNVPATGQVGWFVLELTNPGTNVTFWSGIKRPGGSTPTLSTTGRDKLVYTTVDGGSTWDENVIGKNYS